MLTYRIAKEQHNNINNALSGLGGVFAGGRWHYAGLPVVYSASTRSLAMLERLVNDSTDILRIDLSISTFSLPDNIKIVRLSESELPDNWDSPSYIPDTQQIGSEWLQSFESAILQVPSSVCNEEYNFIINPNHPDAKGISCIDVKLFSYPERLAAKLPQP